MWDGNIVKIIWTNLVDMIRWSFIYMFGILRLRVAHAKRDEQGLPKHLKSLLLT